MQGGRWWSSSPYDWIPMGGTNTTLAAPRVDGSNESGTDGADPAALFEALDDDDCRAIIRATRAQPMSASDLSEACEIPLSTTYRKIELLEEAALLTESIQINSTGGHASTYRTLVDDICLSITDEGDIDVDVEPGGADPTPEVALDD